METIKRLITWKRVKVNDKYYIDPNTNNEFEEVTDGSTFTETAFQIADGRFISVVEYPADTPQARIDGLMQAYSAFEFTFIDELEANLLLSELGDVSVDNFVFTDNRPIDLI